MGGLVRESEERSEALGVDGRGGGLGWFELEGGGKPSRVGAVEERVVRAVEGRKAVGPVRGGETSC